MIKSVFAATAALSMSAGAALCRTLRQHRIPMLHIPMVSTLEATTDLHVGYEGGSGKVGYYVQGGPALVHSESADDTETELSGKVGVTYAATETLGVYGGFSQESLMAKIAMVTRSLIGVLRSV